MKIRNLFEWPAKQAEGWELDIKEHRNFYLYRYLPVCTILFVASVLWHLSAKLSLLAAKTIQNDLIYFASAIVVAFFGISIFFVAGSFAIKQLSPNKEN